MPDIGPWAQTFELEPIDADTTRVHLRPERLTGVKAGLLWAMMRRKVRAEWGSGARAAPLMLAEERVPSGA